MVHGLRRLTFGSACAIAFFAIAVWALAAAGASTAAASVDAEARIADAGAANGLVFRSAAPYNNHVFRPKRRRAYDYACVKPRTQNRIASYFLDGRRAFYGWRDFSVHRTHCRVRHLRIALWERLFIDVSGELEPAYLMRGGDGRNGAERHRERNWGPHKLRHGMVLERDLLRAESARGPRDASRRNRPLRSLIYGPEQRRGHVGKSRGLLCGPSEHPLLPTFTNQPQQGTRRERLLRTLQYKKKARRSKWRYYMNQGPRGQTPYNYLLWTTPNLPNGRFKRGAGQLRAVIARGQKIDRCNVRALHLPMYGWRSNRVKGITVMMYGRVRDASGSPLYGWFVAAWHAKKQQGRRRPAHWHWLVTPRATFMPSARGGR
jgi:hypothetical protein